MTAATKVPVFSRCVLPLLLIDLTATSLRSLLVFSNIHNYCSEPVNVWQALLDLLFTCCFCNLGNVAL